MSIVLIDQGDYKLVSYAGATAYLFSREDRGVALWGDDADCLTEQMAAFWLSWPHASRAALGRYLWTTLEYGLASTPLETV